MSYGFAIDLLAAKRLTAALGGLVVLAALTGAPSAPAAPANTGTIPLQLTEVRSPVARGHYGRIVAVVFPERPLCTIIVDSKHGPAHAQGLDPQRPAVGGRLVWKWQVGADAALGRWPIQVDCGALGTLRTHFRIVR